MYSVAAAAVIVTLQEESIKVSFNGLFKIANSVEGLVKYLGALFGIENVEYNTDRNYVRFSNNIEL